MENNNVPKYVITIGRQFGSGGHVIGRLVAEKLGIAYYDNELLAEAAKSSGMNCNFFEAADERTPSFFGSLMSFSSSFHGNSVAIGSSPISNDNIYRQQSEVIEALVERSSCVIIGRTADYILRNNPRAISIFIHASKESCAKRIMDRDKCKTVDEALALADKRNKARADYYNFYTDKRWGEAMSYDLTLDSSKLSVEQTADLIIAYAKVRLGI